MPACAVRVSTSCERRQGIHITESSPLVERRGQGITASARRSFLASEQSAYIACAAVPALSRTSAVIFPLKTPEGRLCISSKPKPLSGGTKAQPVNSAFALLLLRRCSLSAPTPSSFRT